MLESSLCILYVNKFPSSMRKRVMFVWNTELQTKNSFECIKDGLWSFAIVPDTDIGKWTKEKIEEITYMLCKGGGFKMVGSETNKENAVINLLYNRDSENYKFKVMLLSKKTKGKGEYYVTFDADTCHTNQFKLLKVYPYYFKYPKLKIK
jgi:hypothetical protein